MRSLALAISLAWAELAAAAPLHAAVRQKDLVGVKALLGTGADPEAREDRLVDPDQPTPLHLAARQDSMGIAMALLASGAKVGALDGRRRTPLHDATRRYEFEGGVEVVRLLISRGADVHARDEVGDTALHVAASQSFEAGVELLLGEGAKVNAKNKHGETPLMVAVRSAWSRPDRQSPVVEALIKAGARLEERNDSGLTAFGVAVVDAIPEMVSLLAARGADVHARSNEGDAPLMVAVKRYCDVVARSPFDSDVVVRSRRTVRAVIKAGGDPGRKGKQGVTPRSYDTKHACGVDFDGIADGR